MSDGLREALTAWAGRLESVGGVGRSFADDLRALLAEHPVAATYQEMTTAQAWDEGRRFGQTHWATNYAPEVPGKVDPNPYREPR